MAEEKGTEGKGTSEGTEQNGAGEGTESTALGKTGGEGEGTALGGSGDSEKGTALGGEGGSDADNTTVAVAPESYEEFKLADGVEIGKDNLDKFHALAKDGNLSQEAAQGLMDLMSDHTTASAEATAKVLSDEVSGWLKDSMADGEFGGALYKENVDIALKGIDEVGTPELKQMLNTTGLGNHPEIIRAFYRVGKMVSEGNITEGGKAQGGATEPKSFGDSLYGDDD